MRTYFDCYPCFMRQALEAARRHRLSDDATREVLVAIGEAVREIRPAMTPPEMAGVLSGVVSRYTQADDPYADEKARFTQVALDLYPRLVEHVRESSEPLLTATVIAVVGNIIDLGTLDEGRIVERLEPLLAQELEAAHREPGRIFAFDTFADQLSRAERVLYVGDNAGETVFDRVLVEQIVRQYPHAKITYAVRSRPALNDALLADARAAGLYTAATLIESGSGIPGTLLAEATEEFRSMFANADVIISKGQGNYETLSEADRPIFFLLIAKCEVIARDIDCERGSIVLLDGAAAVRR